MTDWNFRRERWAAFKKGRKDGFNGEMLDQYWLKNRFRKDYEAGCGRGIYQKTLNDLLSHSDCVELSDD